MAIPGLSTFIKMATKAALTEAKNVSQATGNTVSRAQAAKLAVQAKAAVNANASKIATAPKAQAKQIATSIGTSVGRSGARR
jgi:hypothetical protein